jgi:predicted RNase H-like HicB family nuclease
VATVSSLPAPRARAGEVVGILVHNRGMPEYDIIVERDGRWWMIAVPEIDGLTQAEDFDDVEEMARSYIAVATDTTPDEVGVRIVGNREALLEIIEDLRDRLSVHEREENTIPFDAVKAQLDLE